MPSFLSPPQGELEQQGHVGATVLHLSRVNLLYYRSGAVGGSRRESHKLSCAAPSRVEPLHYETRFEGGWELLVFMGCPTYPEYIFHNAELVGMGAAPANVTDSCYFY